MSSDVEAANAELRRREELRDALVSEQAVEILAREIHQELRRGSWENAHPEARTAMRDLAARALRKIARAA